MKGWVPFLICLNLSAWCWPQFGGVDYGSVFRGDFSNACDRARALRPLLRERSRILGIDAGEVEAVGFPELLRFSYLRKWGEDLSLSVFYTQVGSNYGHMSAGPFQMTPNFVAWLEDRVEPKWSRALPALVPLSAPDGPSVRRDRLRRLLSDEGACDLLCFFVWDGIRSHGMDGLPARRRVLRLAALYNRGIQVDLDRAETGRLSPWFPDGRRGTGPRYFYEDVSWWYFTNQYPGMR